jgi:hypothetical protein
LPRGGRCWQGDPSFLRGLRSPEARPRAASSLHPTGVGGGGVRRRFWVLSASCGGLRRSRDPPLLREWIPLEEPMIWESSPESERVGPPGRTGTVATRTLGRTGLASILGRQEFPGILISQLASSPALSRSPPIAKLVKLRSAAARRLTLAIASKEEHEVQMADGGLAGIAEEEGELHQSGMVHPSTSRFSGLGILESKEQESADSAESVDRASRFELCIGSFGPIPFDREADETTSEGTSSSGSTCSEEVCSARLTSRRRLRNLRAPFRAESEAIVARQSKEGAISIVSSSAQGKQTHARDVGSYSLRQWLEEGSQGCIRYVGV